MVTMLYMPKKRGEKRDTVPVSARIDQSLLERFERIGDAMRPVRPTLSQLVAAAIEEFVENHERKVKR